MLTQLTHQLIERYAWEALHLSFHKCCGEPVPCISGVTSLLSHKQASAAPAGGTNTSRLIRKQDTTAAVLAELRKPLTPSKGSLPVSAKTRSPSGDNHLDRGISGVGELDPATASDFLVRIFSAHGICSDGMHTPGPLRPKPLFATIRPACIQHSLMARFQHPTNTSKPLYQ